MEVNFFDIRVSPGEGVDFVFVVSHYVAQAGLELDVFMLSEYCICMEMCLPVRTPSWRRMWAISLSITFHLTPKSQALSVKLELI